MTNPYPPGTEEHLLFAVRHHLEECAKAIALETPGRFPLGIEVVVHPGVFQALACAHASETRHAFNRDPDVLVVGDDVVRLTIRRGVGR